MDGFTWVHRSWAAVVARWRRCKEWLLRVLTLACSKLRPLLWPLVVVIVLIVCWQIVQNWDWLSEDVWTWLGAASNGDGRQETNSATLRNIGLVVAGLIVIALPLAVWRSIVAQRQAKTAQQDLLNERYQQGAEMLGNKVLSVRLGGIYALQRLAEEHPEQYHVQIMGLFCEFARYPTKDPKLHQVPQAIDSGWNTTQDFLATKEFTLETMRLDESSLRMREDVKAVVGAIRVRGRKGIELEREAELRLDLSYADLRHSNLSDADLSSAVLVKANLHRAFLIDAILSGAYLHDADLHRAYLVGTNLSGTYLMYANLSGAGIMDADLSGAILLGANLSGARLSGVRNLTQSQLDGACADPTDPPQIDGSLDPVTREPLVWRGTPLEDEA